LWAVVTFNLQQIWFTWKIIHVTVTVIIFAVTDLRFWLAIIQTCCPLTLFAKIFTVYTFSNPCKFRLPSITLLEQLLIFAGDIIDFAITIVIESVTGLGLWYDLPLATPPFACATRFFPCDTIPFSVCSSRT
tara:strand:+ start:615 stop:1010 length:396 start_codon:yes stop_codon:yes gene_type:complete